MAERQDTPLPTGLIAGGDRPPEHHMRASNQDREAVVDRLGVAMSEGRLSLFEYDERLTLAYRAITYAELSALLTDLPVDAPSAPAPVAAPAERISIDEGGPGVIAELPTGLKVLWTILLTAVLINLVVWASVSAGTGHLAYFWPIWVAGPAGAALLGVSAGVTVIQRSQRATKRQRRLEAARRPPADQAPDTRTTKKAKAKKSATPN